MKKMSRNGMVGFGLACLLLAAGAALAESSESRITLDERIDMALKKAAPDDVFQTFAKMLGAEAVVDPGVSRPISVELHNVRARTLLDTVCESIGCRWSLEPGNPAKLRVTPAPAEGSGESTKPSALKDPIDLKVTRADGLELLQTFGQLLGADLVLDPKVVGKVTLDLKATPVDQSLDALCQTLSCEWTYTEGANGKKPVLRITSRKK